MATVDRRLLPDGTEEVLPPEAARTEAARRRVLDLLHHWGYELIVTSHIEYPESLLTDTGQDLDLCTFRVTNPVSGRLMGFYAGTMPQMMRVDAHGLRRGGSSHLCYAGSVLRTQLRALSTSCSPIQLDAELHGDPNPANDVEVISLMLEILEMVEVPDVYTDLGHVGIYRGLACAAGPSGEVEQQLFDVLQYKVVDEVEALTADLSARLRDMLRALTEPCGSRNALGQGHACLAAAPVDAQVALNELIETVDSLAGRFPGLLLYFDPGELRGYHYHTDVVFAAFVPDVSQSIVQGGHHDDIGADLGHARPATGFSTDLKGPATPGQARLDQVVSGIWAPAERAGLWQAV